MRFVLRVIGLITVFTIGMGYGLYKSDEIMNETLPMFYSEIESEENSTDSEETETE